jgi:hypothetical protein
VSRGTVAIVAGLAGVALGLFIAREYAQWRVNSTLTSGLNSIGLGFLAPTVTTAADGLVG